MADINGHTDKIWPFEANNDDEKNTCVVMIIIDIIFKGRSEKIRDVTGGSHPRLIVGYPKKRANIYFYDARTSRNEHKQR